MFSYEQKKEFLKNGIYMFLILVLAVISTHYIYYQFQDVRNVNFNSESLDVTYREKTGDKIELLKVTPVTDSVGLSSNAYSLSIKNNLTESVDYKIKIVDDEDVEELDEDEIIPKEDLRISVKTGKFNKIYDLEELEEGILLEDTIKALEKKNISIRLWVRHDSTLPSGSAMQYHGVIQVIEEDSSIAIR